MHTLAHRYLDEGGRNRHQPKQEKSRKIGDTCTDDEEVEGGGGLVLEGDRTHPGGIGRKRVDIEMQAGGNKYNNSR